MGAQRRGLISRRASVSVRRLGRRPGLSGAEAQGPRLTRGGNLCPVSSLLLLFSPRPSVTVAAGMSESPGERCQVPSHWRCVGLDVLIQRPCPPLARSILRAGPSGSRARPTVSEARLGQGGVW